METPNRGYQLKHGLHATCSLLIVRSLEGHSNIWLSGPSICTTIAFRHLLADLWETWVHCCECLLPFCGVKSTKVATAHGVEAIQPFFKAEKDPLWVVTASAIWGGAGHTFH
eukprot:2873674-Amphidinium_carterae.1